MNNMTVLYIWDVNIDCIIIEVQKNQLRQKIFLKLNIIFTTHGLGIKTRQVTS